MDECRPWYEENQEELHRVADELRTTTQQLCRNLRDNPDVADNMAKVHMERGHLQVLLATVLNDLETHVYPSLTHMVLDEDERARTMKETIEREKAAPFNGFQPSAQPGPFVTVFSPLCHQKHKNSSC